MPLRPKPPSKPARNCETHIFLVWSSTTPKNRRDTIPIIQVPTERFPSPRRSRRQGAPSDVPLFIDFHSRGLRSVGGTLFESGLQPLIRSWIGEGIS